MTRERKTHLAVILGSLAMAVCFHHVLLFEGSLDAFDWRVHVHYYEWIARSLSEHGTLPLYIPEAFHSRNFIGHPESPLLGPLVGLLLVLPPDAYIKLLLVVYTAVGLTGMVLLMRDLEIPFSTAAVPAVLFAFNGFVTSHFAVGHHWALGVLFWPWMVLLFRRAVLGSRPAIWGLAVTNTICFFEGFHHPLIWIHLLLGVWAIAWAVTGRTVAPILVLAASVALTSALGAVKLLPVIDVFLGYQPPEQIPPLQVEDLFSALTAHGPLYESGSGATGTLSAWCWEYDASIGFLGLAVIAAAAWFGRRPPVALLLPAGLVFVALSVDWGQLGGPAVWFAGVPVLGTQRVPSRLLVVATFAMIVAAGPGLKVLGERLTARGLPVRVFAILACVLAAAIAIESYSGARGWGRFGAGNPVPPMARDLPPAKVLPGGEATVQLAEFHPNRVVWEVDANILSEVVFPLRTGRADRLDWQVEGFHARPLNGWVAVEVPPGRHPVVLEFDPPGFVTGLAISCLTALLGILLSGPVRSLYKSPRKRDTT